MSTVYTQTEIKKAAILMARLLPHLTEGLTMREAMNAVHGRDGKLMESTLRDKELRAAMAYDVYNRIREAV